MWFSPEKILVLEILSEEIVANSRKSYALIRLSLSLPQMGAFIRCAARALRLLGVYSEGRRSEPAKDGDAKNLHRL